MENLFDRVKGAFTGKDTPQQDMVLKVTGPGACISYDLSSYAVQKVEWVSRETDANGAPLHIRLPEETTKEFITGLGFTAAGKAYLHLNQLCVSMDDTGIRGKDIYGREVLCIKERFPCFDSYDYATEKRHYRWFFIRVGNQFTRVFHTDERPKIYVTEDVQNIETRCLEIMKKLGYVQK